MTTFTVTDLQGVIDAQRASAAAYAVARNAYCGYLATSGSDPDPTAFEAIAEFQQLARGVDDEMVEAWTWWGVEWAEPGDEVSDRGLVYPPPVTSADAAEVAVYTSSAAFKTATWLKIDPAGAEDAAAHLLPEHAQQIADRLDTPNTTSPVVTDYGHIVSVVPIGRGGCALGIRHDGTGGVKACDAAAALTPEQAHTVAAQLRRIGGRP